MIMLSLVEPTYHRVILKGLELVRIKRGGKAGEALGVLKVGIGLDRADGGADGRGDGVGLHADDVLVLNELATTGDKDWSRR
jgi:hypothetical protein